MKRNALNASLIALLSGVVTLPTYAADFKIGNPETTTGELSVTGFLRAKFQDKSWTDNDHKLTFDAARVNVDYKSPKVYGHIEYRCYQFDKLCDFSTIVDAYAGYNINDQHLVQAGIQPVPFGPGRYWESNYYGGVVTQIGLEDVHNMGIKYQGKFDTGTTVELAYFTGDGGNYSGPYSDDASRYSTNFVKPEDSSISHLDEKDMFVARVKQKITGLPEGFSTSVGASYWASDIDNKTTGLTGDRKAWALFGNFGYNNLALDVTLGENDVDNKDVADATNSLMGSFDDNFMVANKGTFYTADLSYGFKNVAGFSEISPHFMYSSYVKDQDSYSTSTRNILGVTAYYKDWMFVADYIMGKNDFLLAGPADSYAQGSDSKTNKMLNLQIYYWF